MSGPCRWQLELSLSSQLEPSEALWTLLLHLLFFITKRATLKQIIAILTIRVFLMN
jgi:hypothetical protein